MVENITFDSIFIIPDPSLAPHPNSWQLECQPKVSGMMHQMTAEGKHSDSLPHLWQHWNIVQDMYVDCTKHIFWSFILQIQAVLFMNLFCLLNIKYKIVPKLCTDLYTQNNYNFFIHSYLYGQWHSSNSPSHCELCQKD